MQTIGYAAKDMGGKLSPYHFERRDLRDNDVAIEILYAGICHSDLHTINGDWGEQPMPLVPGHEIIGKVIDIGKSVSQYSVGDHVGVGCMVDSCQECDQCHNHEEQFCREGMTATYGSKDRVSDEVTQGGYSKHIVVREEFVLRVSEKLDISKAAPILCAGITTYKPLKHWGVKEGTRVGVLGLGGLGHMATKIAVAMGAEVTVISHTKEKKEEALNYGAKHFLFSKDDKSMKEAKGSLDLIVDTVPVKHDFNPYTELLDIDGTHVIVGQIGPMEEIITAPLVRGRRSIAGSLIGGIKDTQEVLDLCAEHEIHPHCEIIEPSNVNEAWDTLLTSHPSHRFVMDMSTLKV